MKRLILLFSVSVLLIVQHLEAQTAVTDTVFLQLYNDSVDLKEVVVKGKKTPVANSRWSDMSPVELVTDARKEEFIRSQQHKLAKKGRTRRPTTESRK